MLGGGGAKGLAHSGVLTVMENLGACTCACLSQGRALARVCGCVWFVCLFVHLLGCCGTVQSRSLKQCVLSFLLLLLSFFCCFHFRCSGGHDWGHQHRRFCWRSLLRRRCVLCLVNTTHHTTPPHHNTTQQHNNTTQHNTRLVGAPPLALY